MRPINLIPPEERRRENAPLRTGPLPYLVIGALVAVLVGVAALVVTGNQISERESDLASLQAEDAVARARASKLASYTQFRSLREQRVTTIASLADSRFDWERVMRELALILPSDTWLVSLNASASPNSEASDSGGEAGDSGGSGLRSSVPGPALELSGCATGQEAVARFVTALKDIDGVTRVGVESSQLSEEEEGAGDASQSASEEGSSGGDCRTRDFIAQFEIVVAFDAAPAPVSAEAEAVPAPAAEQATTSTETAGG